MLEIVNGGWSKLAINTLDFTNIYYNKKIISLNPLQIVKYSVNLLTLKVLLANWWSLAPKWGAAK